MHAASASDELLAALSLGVSTATIVHDWADIGLKWAEIVLCNCQMILFILNFITPEARVMVFSVVSHSAFLDWRRWRRCGRVWSASFTWGHNLLLLGNIRWFLHGLHRSEVLVDLVSLARLFLVWSLRRQEVCLEALILVASEFTATSVATRSSLVGGLAMQTLNCSGR